MKTIFNPTAAVIGLGYVGLPLAVAVGRKFRTIGFDLNADLTASYQRQADPNGEVSKKEFEQSDKILFTSNSDHISEADFIVVAVPTPIDHAYQPDLKPLINAAGTAGKYMKKGTVIIFESTVYPGVTEDICVPIIEKLSGYRWKRDSHVGYSPERINPSAKVNPRPWDSI